MAIADLDMAAILIYKFIKNTTFIYKKDTSEYMKEIKLKKSLFFY